ncbi:MAG: linear amide C-N hydrolase [Clostridia bacterium]|nr:linear amide C-N hydrolase [Clostridia bacterium]
MKKFFSLIIVLIFTLSVYSQSDACTIFTKQQNGRVLVGNNEDWMYSIPSTFWIAAPENDTYGRICFANSTYVQGGMNEKGLFYDGATCPASEIPHFKGKPELGMDLGEIIISKCANVREAVEMIKKYNITRSFTDHIMFTDQSGDSVVIEWMNNDLKIIPKKGTYQLITNFWLTDPELGGYPCTRYDKAKTMLEDKDEINVDVFAGILKAVLADWGDMGTKYSNVYDLKKREVFIYNKGDFSKYVRYNLPDELKKLKKGKKVNYKLDKVFRDNTDVLLSPVENERQNIQVGHTGTQIVNDEKDSVLKSKGVPVKKNGVFILYFLIAIIAILLPIVVITVLRKMKNKDLI